jgi:hypothetical protein
LIPASLSIEELGRKRGRIKMRRTVVLALAALAALGGCQKARQRAAQQGSAPASASMTATGAPATGAPTTGALATGAPVTGAPASDAAQAPVRRAGLWAQTVSSAGATQQTRVCLDASLSKRLAAWGDASAGGGCREAPITPRAGGGWSFSSACDGGPDGETVTTGVLTGDPASRYRIEAETRTAGARAQLMNGRRRFSMSAEWLGPCPAGMKPGDMTLPGGEKINLAGLTAGK